MWRDWAARSVARPGAAQVRLELGYIADREAYGADVQEVIGRIMQLSHDDRTDRDVAVLRAPARELQRTPHPLLVSRHRSRAAVRR